MDIKEDFDASIERLDPKSSDIHTAEDDETKCYPDDAAVCTSDPDAFPESEAANMIKTNLPVEKEKNDSVARLSVTPLSGSVLFQNLTDETKRYPDDAVVSTSHPHAIPESEAANMMLAVSLPTTNGICLCQSLLPCVSLSNKTCKRNLFLHIIIRTPTI